MISTRAYQALDFAFALESSDAVLVEVFDRCYRDMPPATGPVHALCARPLEEAGRFEVTIRLPDGEVAVCEDSVIEDAVFEVLAWEVNDRATRSRSAWPILHATVTAGPNGAVLLCGQSHSGKSTLAAGAARRGWWHLSDDLGPVDVEAMMVHPYPRPIMLRAGGRELLGDIPEPPEAHRRFLAQEWFFPASELGATPVEGPQPIVAVALLDWGPDAALEPISRATTLHGLVLSCTTLRERGAAGFADLERIVVAVPGFRLQVSAPDEALDQLASLLGHPAR